MCVVPILLNRRISYREVIVRTNQESARYIWYTHPPHTGKLLYEKLFGVTFEEFQRASGGFIALLV